MKKQVLITFLSLIPAIGFAKVADFDSLISDNVKAQGELHSAVKKNINEARGDVLSNKRERIVVVETAQTSYNAPTRKDFLAFKKERSFHRPSEDKSFERLATELNSLND